MTSLSSCRRTRTSCPAVKFLQGRGLKVINVAWPESGHELKKPRWADVDLNDCKPDIVRRS